jgi:adenine deaminase
MGALRAITISAAKALRVEDRVGSLANGKDADVVLFDGDPFEYAIHVLVVMVGQRRTRGCREPGSRNESTRHSKLGRCDGSMNGYEAPFPAADRQGESAEKQRNRLARPPQSFAATRRFPRRAP